jgi:hypothetical protein
MQKRKQVIAVAAVAAVAATSVGGALAQGRFGSGSPGPKQGVGHRPVLGMLEAAATYLDVTPQALREQLRSGKSLAQVAEARGKSVQGLVDAVVAGAKARLDAAVAAGKAPAEKAAQLLANLKARVAALVARTGPARAASPDNGRPAARGLFGVAAAYLGLTPQALFAQLRAGKSLAQVAQAQGKAVDGLKQAILGAVKARLDTAVDAGRISAAQEQAFLTRLADRLDTLVNRTRPTK